MFDNSAMRYVRKISENPEMAHNKVLDRIRPGSTVLEFGPASGVMTKFLKEEKNCHVSIVEIDKDAYKIAMKYAEHGICSDAQTFEWLEIFKEYRFDYILFVDILEHLTKAGEVLAKSTELLKDEGSVLISVPNAAHNSVIIQMLHNQLLYQDTGILDYSHVHQYTFFELMRMCDDSGFKPVYLDATYIAVGKNEFDVSYMDINPKVAEYLKKRPLGEAYQFIIEIKKKEYVEKNKIKIEDALGFEKSNYNLDDDLLESLALIKSSQSEKDIKALSDSPNKYLVYNNEIERLRLQINDIFETNKNLPDSTRIIQMNYDYQEEVRAKNNHIKILQTSIDDLTAEKGKLNNELELREKRIQTLQEEQAERDAHIKELDEEMKIRGERIQTLQEEQAERNAHIKELDEEMKVRGERIQTLQEEQAERDAHIKELDEEMKVRGERIQTLQEEQAERNAHIKELDEEMKVRGERIQTLQEEQAERDAHIKELDEEMKARGERIQTLQEEQAQHNSHISELEQKIEQKNSELITAQSEINQLMGSNEVLQEYVKQTKEEKHALEEKNNNLVQKHDELKKSYNQVITERDYMEEQRNTLVKERDELKGYHRDLTEECATLKSKVEEMQTELKNKQGHIDLLLESDRELQQIHHSRSWKVLSVWWRFRDFLVPPNSKRRLILKLIGKFIRHPIWCLKRVDRDHIRKFTDGVKNGSIISTSQRLDNYLGGGTENTEKPDQFPIVEYARIDDVPKLHIPSSNHPDISIIIPVYNQFAYTYNCLKSIAKNSGEINYEVIIADDRSSDLTEHIKKAVSGIKVIRNKENLRFLLNCNNAAKSAKGKYILFLNNDTQVMEGWLQPLVELIERNDKIGMVGSKLIYPDGRLQEAGGILWNDGSAWNYGHLDDPTKPEYNYVKEADYISGAAIMIRADLWKQLGGFDEHFAPAYCEDSDLAFQVRAAGYKVMFQPKSVVIHFEGISNGTDTSSGQKSYQIINSQKFHEKWKDVLEKEHNPNGVNPFLAKDKSLQKHTLLFVDHYVPQYDKDAGSRTVFAYLKMFAHAGYNIKFIGDNFFPHQPYTEVLQQLGIEVLYGNWYGQHWKEWLVENRESFDYAFLNRPHIAVKYIDIIREKTNAKILYYGHDLHFLRCSREYEVTGNKKLLSDAEDWKEKEFSLMRKSDVTAYPSVIEVEEIKKNDPSIHAIAIPAYIFDNVDETEYTLSKRKDLFFIGGYTHGPNIDAVKWFISEILPMVLKAIPQVRIHLAGSNMPQELTDLASENVIIEGMVTDEQLEHFYHSTRLNVVPLRYGAGIKGKIVESMRYGLPVVTTPCGAEGIQGAESILAIGKNAEEIAALIISLYDDENKLSQMSKEGKQYVLDHYSEHGAIEVMSKEFDLE